MPRSDRLEQFLTTCSIYNTYIYFFLFAKMIFDVE